MTWNYTTKNATWICTKIRLGKRTWQNLCWKMESVHPISGPSLFKYENNYCFSFTVGLHSVPNTTFVFNLNSCSPKSVYIIDNFFIGFGDLISGRVYT